MQQLEVRSSRMLRYEDKEYDILKCTKLVQEIRQATEAELTAALKKRSWSDCE
jgi:hypothetical protein